LFSDLEYVADIQQKQFNLSRKYYSNSENYIYSHNININKNVKPINKTFINEN